jgi:nucleoid DNA-binding protein
MNDPAEIPTDLSSDELAERLEAALEAAGWRLGHTDETPHHARLLYRPRTRSPSFDLAGMSASAEHDVVESVARDYGGRIAYLADLLIEWRGGREVVFLGKSAAGHFQDLTWSQIRDNAEPAVDLPREVMEALRADPPDSDTMIEALAAHLYGEPSEIEASAEVALVEAYHPFDPTWRDALEPLFLEIRRRLSEGHEVEVPGLASFRRLDSERGMFEAVHRAGDALRALFAGERGDLAVDLSPVLGAAPDPAIERALAEACSRSRDGQVDVLLGADLALHTAIYPPFEGVNPRTGEPIVIPGRKMPIFIGW